MGIRLTFDEYVELRRQPVGGPNPGSQETGETANKDMFPMNATAASGHLRSKGYDCKPTKLDLLVEDGVIKLAKPDTWTQSDVDKAAEHLKQCEIFTPYAAMCYTLGCRYVDFKRPLHEAAKRES